MHSTLTSDLPKYFLYNNWLALRVLFCYAIEQVSSCFVSDETVIELS